MTDLHFSNDVLHVVLLWVDIIPGNTYFFFSPIWACMEEHKTKWSWISPIKQVLSFIPKGWTRAKLRTIAEFLIKTTTMIVLHTIFLISHSAGCTLNIYIYTHIFQSKYTTHGHMAVVIITTPWAKIKSEKNTLGTSIAVCGNKRTTQTVWGSSQESIGRSERCRIAQARASACP